MNRITFKFYKALLNGDKLALSRSDLKEKVVPHLRGLSMKDLFPILYED
jgi:hypothetical protein